MASTEVKHLKALTDGSVPFSRGLDGPPGSILIGDALDLSGRLPSGCVDLVYLDPPFFTKRDHHGNARKSTKPSATPALRSSTSEPPEHSFSDRWHDGLEGYLAWLRDRIVALRRLLKPTGVMLLHLDWHAVHYAKVLCDELFVDGGGFQNELIWYYQTGGASKGRFSRKHDTILLYSNGPAFYFDGRAVAIPRGKGAMKRAQCPTGARIKLTDTHKNPDDVLVVPALNPMARERNGYPTQKPVALLEILIKALCPPDGTVADFFCGSGTTLVAAQKLGRRWIGGDASSAAVELARARLGR